MKDNDCIDCEIIIVTDGEDNQCDGSFYGSTGFDESMPQLKGRIINRYREYTFIVMNVHLRLENIIKNYQ